MRRVVVIGSPGAGKSTLATQLAKQCDLPLFHLDRMFWRPGWTPTAREDFFAEQSRVTQTDQWIIDGNYNGSLPLRLNAAETIIFLDLPTWVCLSRIVRRSFRGTHRADMGDGCREQPFSKDYAEFLLFVINFRRQSRPRIMSLLRECGKGKTIHHLQSSAQVAQFVETIL